MRKSAIFLLIPFLFGCANQKPFPFSNLGDLPNFDRNGELLLMEKDKLASYLIEDVTKEIDLSGMKRQIDMNEDFFLLFSQPSKKCSHCAALEPKLTEFCFDSQTDIYSHEPRANDSVIAALADAYPDSNLNILLDSLETPVIHFIDVTDGVPEAKKIDFYDRMDTTAHFENFLKPLFNLSSIYHFQTYEAVSRFEEADYLIYFDEGDELSASFYRDNLQKDAKSHDKPVVYLELASFSEEDRLSLLASFELTETDHLLGVVSQGKSPSFASFMNEKEQAIQLIEDYYD